MPHRTSLAETTAITRQAREKYRLERERRVHPNGIEQYEGVPIDSPPSVVSAPPQNPPALQRPRAILDAVVIGGGIAGILAAIRLLQAGVQEIRILEKADGLGGTWHYNRYPGVRCDIESYIYMPLLEEIGHIPSEKYATGEEIRKHLIHVAREFGLAKRTILGCKVTGLRWLEDDSVWQVSTSAQQFFAKFVIHAGGLFTMPKVPRVPGMERFKGTMFHTSRWDYDYTGQDLSLLCHRRVGIIGSGATAVQCIPALAAASGRLYVFQRTPSSVAARNNRLTDRAWASTLPAGWQHERMVNFAECASGVGRDVDLVDDGWTHMMRRVGGYFMKDSKLSAAELESALEEQDLQYMDTVRARVDDFVEERRTAELLKPYYRVFCKRPCFSDEYLPAFNRPNVELVDVSGDNRIREFYREGIVAGSRSFDLDCIVFATGFRIGTGVSDRCGFDPVGQNGRTLSDKWRSGPATLHGFMTNGFPNLFFLGAIQTGASSNYTHMMYEQTAHVVSIIQACRERGRTCVEPSTEAEARWVRTVRESAKGNVKFLRECTPGYFNQEGRPEDPNALIASQYGGSFLEFSGMLEVWKRTLQTTDLAFR